jgi:hypothetical protein
MKDIKTKLINIAASMAKGRHLQNVQVIAETQKTVSARKLSFEVESIEDKQNLDAAFLKDVFDYIIKLEKQCATASAQMSHNRG